MSEVPRRGKSGHRVRGKTECEDASIDWKKAATNQENPGAPGSWADKEGPPPNTCCLLRLQWAHSPAKTLISGSQPPEHEMMASCCFKPPVCAPLLQQLLESNTTVNRLVTSICKGFSDTVCIPLLGTGMMVPVCGPHMN